MMKLPSNLLWGLFLSLAAGTSRMVAGAATGSNSNSNNNSSNDHLYQASSAEVIQSLMNGNQYEELYVKYHRCVWSDYEGGCEASGDTWYSGYTSCRRANIAYSLYGVPKKSTEDELNRNANKGVCRKANYINTFFTTQGVGPFASSMAIYNYPSSSCSANVNGNGDNYNKNNQNENQNGNQNQNQNENQNQNQNNQNQNQNNNQNNNQNQNQNQNNNEGNQNQNQNNNEGNQNQNQNNNEGEEHEGNEQQQEGENQNDQHNEENNDQHNDENQNGGEENNHGGERFLSNSYSYTTYCNADGSFAQGSFVGDYCSSTDGVTLVDELANFNTAMESMECTQIYWAPDEYHNNNNNNNDDGVDEDVLTMLAYSESCSTFEYPNACHDPHGIKRSMDYRPQSQKSLWKRVSWMDRTSFVFWMMTALLLLIPCCFPRRYRNENRDKGFLCFRGRRNKTANNSSNDDDMDYENGTTRTRSNSSDGSTRKKKGFGYWFRTRVLRRSS